MCNGTCGPRPNLDATLEPHPRDRIRSVEEVPVGDTVENGGGFLRATQRAANGLSGEPWSTVMPSLNLSRFSPAPSSEQSGDSRSSRPPGQKSSARIIVLPVGIPV